MSYTKITTIDWADGKPRALTTSGANGAWLTASNVPPNSSPPPAPNDDFALSSSPSLDWTATSLSQLQGVSNKQCLSRFVGWQFDPYCSGFPPPSNFAWYTSKGKPGVSEPTFYIAADDHVPPQDYEALGAEDGHFKYPCSNTTYPGSCHFLDQNGVVACCQVPVESKATSQDNQILDDYCAPNYDPRPNKEGSYCVNVMTNYCEDHWQPGGECVTWLGLNPFLGKAVVDNTIKNYINQKIATSGIKKGYYNPNVNVK